jgi:hypothetical protein
MEQTKRMGSHVKTLLYLMLQTSRGISACIVTMMVLQMYRSQQNWLDNQLQERDRYHPRTPVRPPGPILCIPASRYLNHLLQATRSVVESSSIWLVWSCLPLYLKGVDPTLSRSEDKSSHLDFFPFLPSHSAPLLLSLSFSLQFYSKGNPTSRSFCPISLCFHCNPYYPTVPAPC